MSEFVNGWFLFAPVKIKDPYGDCIVLARFGIIGEMVFDIAEIICQTMNFLFSIVIRDYEPFFPLYITGEHHDE